MNLFIYSISYLSFQIHFFLGVFCTFKVL